jgi:2Fe-2S ferredoxin
MRSVAHQRSPISATARGFRQPASGSCTRPDSSPRCKPATHGFAFEGLWQCSRLQAFEVGIDPAHPSSLQRCTADGQGGKPCGRQFRAASVDEVDGARWPATRAPAGGASSPVWMRRRTSRPCARSARRTSRCPTASPGTAATTTAFDPAEQRSRIVRGIREEDVDRHDQWAVESSGAIRDRTLIMVRRRRPLQAIETVQQGGTPLARRRAGPCRLPSTSRACSVRIAWCDPQGHLRCKTLAVSASAAAPAEALDRGASCAGRHRQGGADPGPAAPGRRVQSRGISDARTMPAVHILESDGRRHTLSIPAGRNLMRAATDAGVAGIAAECGGMLACATCHVYVDPAWAPRLLPPSADELAMLALTAAERRPTSRLCCQLTLDEALDGLAIELPATQY